MANGRAAPRRPCFPRDKYFRRPGAGRRLCGSPFSRPIARPSNYRAETEIPIHIAICHTTGRLPCSPIRITQPGCSQSGPRAISRPRMRSRQIGPERNDAGHSAPSLAEEPTRLEDLICRHAAAPSYVGLQLKYDARSIWRANQYMVANPTSGRKLGPEADWRPYKRETHRHPTNRIIRKLTGPIPHTAQSAPYFSGYRSQLPPFRDEARLPDKAKRSPATRPLIWRSVRAHTTDDRSRKPAPAGAAFTGLRPMARISHQYAMWPTADIRNRRVVCETSFPE